MNTERVKKRSFSGFFFFDWTNRSILMFHIFTFCSYFKYLHFLYRFFFIQLVFLFYKRKTCFLQLFDFFSHTFFTGLESTQVKCTHFFSDGLSRLSWREMLVYNFFPIKFYFYWTITTRVYEGEVYYITCIKNRKQLNIL